MAHKRRGPLSERFVCVKPTHGHGVGCYRHCKCRCDVCLDANSRATTKYAHELGVYLGRDVWVSAAPVARRLRALAVLGWSAVDLAEMYGVDRRGVSRARLGERLNVRASTRKWAERMYADLSMTPATGKSADTTRARAIKNGWWAPMDLEMIDIDAPWGADRTLYPSNEELEIE